MTYFDNDIVGKEFDEGTGQELPPRPYVKSKERFADEQERKANLSPEERQKEIEEHYRSEGLRLPS